MTNSQLLDTLNAAVAGSGVRVISDAGDKASFLLDQRGRWRGDALAVVQPSCTEEVAAVVRWCAENCVAVVAQGGNTGLSGGSVPEAATPEATGVASSDTGLAAKEPTKGQPTKGQPAIVLSLQRMNRVRAVDPVNNTLTVEAGCILEAVQQAASGAGRLFPLSLAAQGSCSIGGNLATNAGGVQVLRYGNARELCLGLEVVTAQGEVWHGLRGLRKDNTGYDLRDLFVGSEGTLGVITAAVLKLFPLPKAKVCAVVAVPSPAVALQLLALAQSQLASGLTAFELISHFCLQLVLKHSVGARAPLSEASPWYVLLELSDFVGDAHAQEAIQNLLEAALEQNLTSDAAVSSNLAQFQALWALREEISWAQSKEGKNIKHDIAVPISDIAQFIETAQNAVLSAFPAVRMVIFGHLGDGNLHYNVSPAEGVYGNAAAEQAFMAQQDGINRIVHDLVAAFKGSISAEHGLGVLRRDEAARYKSPVEMALQRSIKNALDPQGIMNPNKVLSSV